MPDKAAAAMADETEVDSDLREELRTTKRLISATVSEMDAWKARLVVLTELLSNEKEVSKKKAIKGEMEKIEANIKQNKEYHMALLKKEARLEDTSAASAPAAPLKDMLDSMAITLGVIAQSLPKFEQGGSISPSAASKDKERTLALLSKLGLAHRPTIVNENGADGKPICFTGEKKWILKFKWASAKSADSDPAGADRDVDGDDLTDALTLAEKRDKVPPLQGDYREADSYGAIVAFLKGHGMVAYVVGDGQMLGNKNLFDVELWTVRPKDPLEKGQDVHYISHLRGRTDIVILAEDYPKMDGNDTILRDHVKVLVEIKTPSTMSTTGSLHEAMMQLIGANVQNQFRSPPVVVSNLAQKHYVLYLTRESSSERPHYYVIRQMLCASFGAAIEFALSKAHVSCSEHFCRPRSREPSPPSTPEKD